MSRSRAWTIWTASLLVCPLVIFAFGVAFDARWLPPDRSGSGWFSRAIGVLMVAHAAVSLVAAIAPPRPARGEWYWLALGFVLVVLWLTLILAMGASMASYYE
jgi:hypothetical protein